MPRTYEGTHPWLNFALDTNRFSHRLWMALGEAGSKCEHIAGVPLDPETAKRMHLLYLAKGAAATTAIEGNTLSEEEAERVLSGKLKLPSSQQYLADELENVVDACNYIQTKIDQPGPNIITVDFLLEINRKVLRNLRLDEDVTPGQIRQHKVVVGKYRCAPPEDCHYLLQRLCDILNNFPCPENSKSQFCVLKAVFAHLYLVWIHPFGDGNGRTARLLELHILLAGGFPSPAGHLLSNYYNKTRSEYYRKLNEAITPPDGVINFIEYSVQGLVEGLREQIRFIKDQQWNVSWINYVHNTFHDKNSPTDVRRKHIVLELTKLADPIPVSKIINLSGDIGRAYADKTPKTLVRDINALVEMRLIERKRGTVRAKKETILAFLPWRNLEEDAA